MPDTAMDWRAHIAAAMRQTEANLDKLNVPCALAIVGIAPGAFYSLSLSFFQKIQILKFPRFCKDVATHKQS